MSIQQFGVQVSNPDCLIKIEGQSFGELICYQHLHTENLKGAIATLNILNRDGSDEQLSNLQIILQALANTSADALQDYLRVARAQGLRFELLLPGTSYVHH